MHKIYELAHLDIKFENIVVDADYSLKLIDFAYCEQIETNLTSPKGTYNYFSPEMCQIYNKNTVLYSSTKGSIPTYNAKKADIFSLGIILFTMYFGKKPFEHNDPKKETLLELIGSQNLYDVEIFFQSHSMTRAMNKNGRVPREIKILIANMLQINPLMRPDLEFIINNSAWIKYGPHNKMLSVE